MPPRQPSKIGYTGRESLAESLVLEPADVELERERLQHENGILRDQVRQLRQTLRAVGVLIAPYYNRLMNGGSNGSS